MNPCKMVTRFFPILLLLATTTLAAPGDLIREGTYGGTDQDWGFDVAATQDGGLVITGYTSGMGAGGRDVYLARIAADGALEWETPLGNVANDEGSAVIATPDGGFLVAGNMNIGSTNSTQGLLIKTDGQGNVLWNRTYGSAGFDEFLAVTACAEGGYAAAGTTIPGSVGQVAWVVRVDEDGEVLWETSTSIGGQGNVLTDLVETPDGRLVASGYNSNGVTFPTFDARIVAFSSSGSLLWSRAFDHGHNDRAYGIARTESGGFALGGISASGMTIWRTDDDGQLDWLHRFTTVTADTGLDILACPDGGFVVVGQTYDYDLQNQVFVGKTDALGAPLWERQYGDEDNQTCRGVAMAQPGEIALLGTTDFYDPGDDNLLLLILEDTPATSAAPGDDTPRPLATSLQAYPNPFNPQTTIAFRLDQPGNAQVDILDARGVRVRTLLSDASLDSGEHTLVWNGRGDGGRLLGSGVYLARVRHGQEQAVVRVSLIK